MCLLFGIKEKPEKKTFSYKKKRLKKKKKKKRLIEKKERKKKGKEMGILEGLVYS